MMTQRMRSAGTANVVLMAGNAMFTTESSETRAAPAAATVRVTAAIMAHGVARAGASTVQPPRHGPAPRRHARPHVDGHAGEDRRRHGQPGRPRVRDAVGRRPARAGVRHHDHATPAPGRLDGGHHGRVAASRGHAGGHGGAGHRDAPGDRRPALPVLGGGPGRPGQDRRGPARALRRARPRRVPGARDEEGRAMTSQIDRRLVGKEYPPYVVTVERGKIKEFARAIGDSNPFYLDDRVGQASEWGDIIAPPTFATTFRDETADTQAF